MAEPAHEADQRVVISKTITGEDLLERIYQNQSLPQDKRFLPVDRGGVFEYFDVGNLIGIHSHINDKSYSIVEVNDEIVGLAGLEKDPNNKQNLWIKFVSVDPKYGNKGYASKLLEEVFIFAQSEGCSLKPSTYSEEGKKKLEKIILRLAEKYHVQLLGS